MSSLETPNVDHAPVHMSPSPPSGTSYFANASNFRIGRQEIVHVQQQNIEQQIVQHYTAVSNDTPSCSPSDPILDASYLRDRKASPPDSICLVGTREGVIKEILDWMVERPRTKDDKHILWLYGYVGCGKSAIAQTVAEDLARRERLAASFFFFRSDGARSRTNRLAATICDQMSRSVPFMKSLVKAAIKKHPGVFHYSIDKQFQHLIFEPFKSAINRGFGVSTLLSGPYVIVIDGLDECEDRDAAVAWIRGLVEFFSQNPRVPLKIFISSRVEDHLSSFLTLSQVKVFDLANISHDKDIAYVLERAFDHAAETNRVIQAYGGRWPTQSDKSELVKHIGGSFIFLATIIKFILEPGADHKDRLAKALKIDPGLDGLYAETLARSRPLPYFSDIISTIAPSLVPLSVNSMATFLQIPKSDIVRVLLNLHSILHVPDNDDLPVAVCHTSLPDFLTNKSRSKDLYVTPRSHKRLVEGFIRTLFSEFPLTGARASVVEAVGWPFPIGHWGKYWRQVKDDADPERLLDLARSAVPPAGIEAFETVASICVAALQDASVFHGGGARRKLSELLRLLYQGRVNVMAMDFVAVAVHDMWPVMTDREKEAYSRPRTTESGILIPPHYTILVRGIAKCLLTRIDDSADRSSGRVYFFACLQKASYLSLIDLVHLWIRSLPKALSSEYGVPVDMQELVEVQQFLEPREVEAYINEDHRRTLNRETLELNLRLAREMLSRQNVKGPHRATRTPSACSQHDQAGQGPSDVGANLKTPWEWALLPQSGLKIPTFEAILSCNFGSARISMFDIYRAYEQLCLCISPECAAGHFEEPCPMAKSFHSDGLTYPVSVVRGMEWPKVTGVKLVYDFKFIPNYHL